MGTQVKQQLMRMVLQRAAQNMQQVGQLTARAGSNLNRMV